MLLAFAQGGPVYVFDRPIRMLVVDDDPIMREFASMQLAMPGGEIVTAIDGEDAWTILEGEGGFDLILSDLEMPRLGGFALLERIRQSPRHAALPVVVITSRDDMFAIDRAYEVGATAFATKPINWRQLGHQLRYVLRSAGMESELRKARDAAQAAAELKRNLLTLLQHEARTPLNAIIGHCDLFRRLTADIGHEAARQSATQVSDAAWELNETLRRVLYLSQLSAGTLALDREEVRLSTVVEEAARAMRPVIADGRLTVRVAAAAEDPIVSCDLRCLTTALVELLTNSAEHGGPHASVEIGWSHPADGRVVLSLRDRGPGLPHEIVGRWHQPFGQVADPLTHREGGLGIGLATAAAAIRLHGGEMDMRSEPDGGASAHITLAVTATARAALSA